MMPSGSKALARALRLQPHHHTGRRLPRHHTSYAAMAFMMVLTGVLLVGVSLSSEAATGGANASYPAPAIPATITSPSAGTELSSSPIIVRGVCQPGTVVRLDADGVLRGSAQCDPNGNFELKAALLSGNNTFTARTFSTEGVEGPVSQTVEVKLKGAGALWLSSPGLRLSAKTGQAVSWQLTLQGGRAPYAVLIDWGDGSTNLASQSGSGTLSSNHTYKTAGSYTAIANVKDASGVSGYFQELALVSSYAASPAVKAAGLPNLALAWPVYIAAGLLLFSFWLGEKFEDERESERREGPPNVVKLSS